MSITIDTITDAQICKLWGDACGIGAADTDPDTMHLCTVALNRNGDFTFTESETARARCVELLNARTKKCCPARDHERHVGDVCTGTCCTSCTNCGGPIDENEECRC